MKLKNTRAKLAGKASGLALLASTLASTQATAEPYFFSGLNLGVDYHSPSISVSGVSKEMRTVPIHGDDPGAGTLIEIPETTLRPNSWSWPYLFFGAGVKKDSWDLRAGASATFLFELGQDDAIQEYNYRGGGGEDRVTGAALVYYRLNRESTLIPFAKNYLVPEFFARLSKEIVPSLEVFLGYNAQIENIAVENGWDRWGSLEAKETRDLGRLLNNSFMLGLRWSAERNGMRRFLDISGGVDYPMFSKSDAASEVTIEEDSPGFNVGVKVGMEL